MIIYDAEITGSFKIDGTTISSIGSLDTLSGSIVTNSASIAALESVSGSYADSASFATDISTNSSSIASLEAASGSYADSASFASERLLNTTDTFTGDLTVTGEVIAQTLNVQQVTSSIVYSSGSNQFGNDVSNTQQFTGSLQVSGSTHHLLGNVGIGTTSPNDYGSTTVTIASDATNTVSGLAIRNSDGSLRGSVYQDPVNSRVAIGASTNHSVLFIQSDSQAALIDTSQNMIIGTGSPYQKLHIQASGTSGLTSASNRGVLISDEFGARLVLEHTDAISGEKNYVLRSEDGIFSIALLNDVGNGWITDSIFNINPSGSAGIGVTPSTIWSTSYSALQIGAGGSLYAHSSAGNALKIGSNIVYEGTAPNYYDKYLNDSTATKYEQDAGTHSWHVASSGTTGNAVSWTEAMRIINSGNVGIGVVSPSTTFNVGHASHGVGIAYLGGDALPSIAGIFTSNGTAGGESGYGDLLIKSRSDYGVYSINFFTAASNNTPLERMRIDSDGNVGIGTDLPAEKLHVRDPGANSDVYIKMGNDSRDWFMGIEGSNSDIYTIKTHDSSNVFNIDSGGKVGIRVAGPHGDLQFPTETNTRKIVLYEGANNDYQFYGLGVESNTFVYSVYNTGDDHVFFAGVDGSSRNELMRVRGAGGITFNGDTAAANALDDYEEGTFTPTYIGSSGGSPTYATQLGKYTKIGNVVTIHLWLRSNKGTLSGDIYVGGLPFAPNSSVPTIVNAVPYRRWATDFNVFGSIESNSRIYLYKVDSDVLSVVTVTDADMNDSGTNYNNLGVSVSYLTD